MGIDKKKALNRKMMTQTRIVVYTRTIMQGIGSLPWGQKRRQNNQTGTFFKNQPMGWFLMTISDIKTIANTKLPPFPKRA